MIYGSTSDAAIARLARVLASMFVRHPGLYEELVQRKHDPREAALMDVNEFIFSLRSPLTVGDRLEILDRALTMADRMTGDDNVISVRFKKD